MELGATREDAEAALKVREPEGQSEVVEIWESNVEAFDLFCRLETQWNLAAGFVIVHTGIRYEAAIAIMRDLGVKRARRVELLEDLKAMELAARPILNGEDADA